MEKDWTAEGHKYDRTQESDDEVEHRAKSSAAAAHVLAALADEDVRAES